MVQQQTWHTGRPPRLASLGDLRVFLTRCNPEDATLAGFDKSVRAWARGSELCRTLLLSLTCFQLHGLGSGFEPTTTSGISPSPGCQLINLDSSPTTLKADCRVAKVGVSITNEGGGGFDGSKLAGPRVKIPIPITCISKWFVMLFSFLTVHPASLNKASSCFAKLNPSSPPPDVYPKSIVPAGTARRDSTNAKASLSVNLRGFTRSWSCSRLFSAIAALVCCFAISVSAFATSVSRPATLASAFAARSCCLPSSVLALVMSPSNCRSCLAWRSLMTLPVINTPAPARNVRNSKTTAAMSKNDFRDSTDTKVLLPTIPKGTAVSRNDLRDGYGVSANLVVHEDGVYQTLYTAVATLCGLCAVISKSGVYPV